MHYALKSLHVQRSNGNNKIGPVYIRPKVKSNRFEISNCFAMLFRLHGSLHGDFIVATLQTIARLYCTCANEQSKAHAHYLATLMILRNFFSLRAFTVYMEDSL